MAIAVIHPNINHVDQSLSEKFSSTAQVAEVNVKDHLAAQLQEPPHSSYLLPRGTVDTHVHVFDPRLGPYSPTRAYTPERASYSHLTAFSESLSASTPSAAATFVLVQPSPYRNDNRVLFHLLKQSRDAGIMARGIAVVDVDVVAEQELQMMHELGVRGLRLNMQADGKDVNIKRLEAILKAAAKKISMMPGWMLQVYAPAYIWTELHDTIMALPVPVITDHIGGLFGTSKLPLEQFNNPTRQPGFDALLALAKASRVFIKISGLYRASTEEQNGFEDMEHIIRRLAAEVPHRLIWGSDWPHTGEGKDRARRKDVEQTEPFRVIDNVRILANLKHWVGSEETWKKMMVETPRRIFA